MYFITKIKFSLVTSLVGYEVFLSLQTQNWDWSNIVGSLVLSGMCISVFNTSKPKISFIRTLIASAVISIAAFGISGSLAIVEGLQLALYFLFFILCGLGAAVISVVLAKIAGRG